MSASSLHRESTDSLIITFIELYMCAFRNNMASSIYIYLKQCSIGGICNMCHSDIIHFVLFLPLVELFCVY